MHVYLYTCMCIACVCVCIVRIDDEWRMTKRAVSHFDCAYMTFSSRCVQIINKWACLIHFWGNCAPSNERSDMKTWLWSTLREWGMHVELCVSARGSRIQGRPIWLICVYHMPWHFVTDHLFKYIHAHPCMYCPYWVELPVGTSVQRHIVRDDLTLCRCVPSHMMQLSCLFYFLEY